MHNSKFSRTVANYFSTFRIQIYRHTLHRWRQIKLLLFGCSPDSVTQYIANDAQAFHVPPPAKQFNKCYYPNDYSEVENKVLLWNGPPSIKASIIVASYNQKQTLNLNLLAWVHQTYPMNLFEIIVADDGSSDGTNELVAELQNSLPYSLKFYTQEDSGFRLAKVRNEGVTLSEGEVVFFVDADTIPSPEYIWEHMKYYHVSDRVAVVGMRHRIAPDRVDQEIVRTRINSLKKLPMLEDQAASDEVKKWRKNVLFNNVIWRKQFTVWGGFHGTLGSCRRKDYLGVGGNDESFTAYGQEDSEFAFRLMSKVQYLVSNPKALIFHIEHPDNSGKKDPQNMEVFKKKTTNPQVSICLVITDPIKPLFIDRVRALYEELPHDFEIVLVNSSTDTIFKKEIEKYRYASQFRVFNEPQQASGTSYNQAFLYSRGKFIVVIKLDTQTNIGTLQEFINKTSLHEGVGFFYSGKYQLNQTEPFIELDKTITGDQFIYGSMPALPWIVHKSCFVLTEGFNPSLNEMAEFDIALKLEEVCRTMNIQEILSSPAKSIYSEEPATKSSLIISTINQSLERRAIPLKVTETNNKIFFN